MRNNCRQQEEQESQHADSLTQHTQRERSSPFFPFRCAAEGECQDYPSLVRLQASVLGRSSDGVPAFLRVYIRSLITARSAAWEDLACGGAVMEREETTQIITSCSPEPFSFQIHDCGLHRPSAEWGALDVRR